MKERYCVIHKSMKEMYQYFVRSETFFQKRRIFQFFSEII